MGLNRQEERGGGLSAALGPQVRGRLVSVGIGAIAGGLGVLVVAVIRAAVVETTVFTPLIGAVVVAVWLAGWRAAVAAMITGWGIADWALTPPEGSFAMSSREDVVRWSMSLLIGGVIATVGFKMRRGHERAAAAAEREERSRLRVERLQALAGDLSAALTLEEVAGVLVGGVPGVIGATGGSLGLVEGDELVIVDPRGAQGQTLTPGSRFPLSTRAPITSAASTGRPVWVQRRRDFVELFPEGAALAPYASGALAVPVFVGDRLAAAMGFPFVDADSITADVRTVAFIAADLGGQALERAGLYEEERSSRESLERILAVAPRFQRDATPEEIVISICAEARRAFGCDVVQVWTPVEADDLEVTWRDPPIERIPPGTRLAWANFPGLVELMRAAKSMFVSNAQVGSRGLAQLHARELGIFSSLRIPVVIGGVFERVLVLQWERQITEPTPSVLAVMRRFADQAGLAIEQAARRKAQDETRALQAVTEALAAAATPAEVGSAVVREGVRALGAHAGMVFAASEDGTALQLVASDGYPDETVALWGTLALSDSVPLTDAIRGRELVVLESSEEIAERYPALRASEASIVAVPLTVADRLVGGVVIGSSEVRRSADLGLIVSLAGQAAQALDRALLFERERASARRLDKLQAVTAALSTAVTTDDVGRTCLEHAIAGLGASAGVIVVRTGGGLIDEGSLTVSTAVEGEGVTGSEVPTGARSAIDACLAGSPIAVSDGGWVAVSLAESALAVLAPMPLLPDADREWLLTLASQGGQALDRAGRYETEREIAETMQRSVLPDHLPAVTGATLAARYLPGTVGLQVGGDWYDVIHLDDHRIGLVVGDVVGKGVQAAAMMGQLRNAIRAFSFEHDDPHSVVSKLDSLVLRTIEAAFATLAYLVVDPETGRVDYVLAGHPPPVVRYADGRVVFLDGGRRLPIGVDASLAFEAGAFELEPGSTILLYTDGLVERRGTSLDDSLGLLAEAAAASSGGPEQLVDAVLAALVKDEARPDDIAVLAMRLASPRVQGLELVLPATNGGLTEMRQALRAWLGRARVDSEQAAEAVLAVWEACANAVEHAQSPTEQRFRLTGMLDDGGLLRIGVRDSGRWRTGHASVDRGLGLGLMDELMDTVRVTPGEAGTEVVLERLVRLEEGV